MMQMHDAIPHPTGGVQRRHHGQEGFLHQNLDHQHSASVRDLLSIMQQQQSQPHASQELAVIAPDEADLRGFKDDVRMWMELDNSIARLRAAAKERQTAKAQVAQRVLGFMSRHNIEDLHTREGRLRYQVSFVRAPLTQRVIRERIAQFYAGDETAAGAVHEAVFGNRVREERASLRRMKPPQQPTAGT